MMPVKRQPHDDENKKAPAQAKEAEPEAKGTEEEMDTGVATKQESCAIPDANLSTDVEREDTASHPMPEEIASNSIPEDSATLMEQVATSTTTATEGQKRRRRRKKVPTTRTYFENGYMGTSPSRSPPHARV